MLTTHSLTHSLLLSKIHLGSTKCSKLPRKRCNKVRYKACTMLLKSLPFSKLVKQLSKSTIRTLYGHSQLCFCTVNIKLAA
ncbi:hypothetical protein GLYMA_02G018100v4 [Glycine max]|uniref:Uncharacterized protein n=1 Tax=Glycine max TaxID=3847 RepID=K7K5Y5_SOYBN|nr:hypothetical protein JHK87_054860 [Glycine soja]KAG5061910.1 hypothetical protein JHK85_003093 [Glycine max]KAH1058304.1 hypothetical protein GYH30_002736 [Glycine max]KRH69294.1 hypothetical protein GLYMA_02G018100v4 [Glycine max]